MGVCFLSVRGEGCLIRRLGSRYGRALTVAANVGDRCDKSSERTHHSGARAIVNTG